MSKAVVFAGYGDVDVLRVIDVEVPEPGPGQVRVRVKAAAVQPFDVAFHSGAVASWMPASFDDGGQRLGNEAAGVVEAVGAGVRGFAAGDEVLGWTKLGAFAEHILIDEGHLVRKPASMPWAEAGALTGSGQTACTCVTDLGVTSGETLLIHAAAGGVGGYAVQIAIAKGATVVGSASERNHAYLRSLGARPVAYGPGLADRVREIAPEGIDASLDAIATEESLRTSLELVADRERVGAIASGPYVDKLGVRALRTVRDLDSLGALVDLYTSGRLRVEVAGTYPLDRVADASREVGGRHVRGKIVLIP